MSFAAYFDESGTHASSQRTVLAAVLMDEAYLDALNSRWSLMLRCYGLSHLHAVDMYGRRRQFKNLVPNQIINLIEAAGEYTATYSKFCVTAVLYNSDYDMHYKTRDVPRKVRLDSRYGLCFRNTLCYACEKLLAETGYVTDLNVVVEAGHKNAGELKNIFKELQDLGYEPFSSMLRSISFGTKADHYGLQMADMLAYPVLKLEGNSMPEGIAVDIEKRNIGPARKGIVVRMPLTAGQMAEQRENLIEIYKNDLISRKKVRIKGSKNDPEPPS